MQQELHQCTTIIANSTVSSAHRWLHGDAVILNIAFAERFTVFLNAVHTLSLHLTCLESTEKISNKNSMAAAWLLLGCCLYTNAARYTQKCSRFSYNFFFFWIQFNIRFKTVSAHMRRANQQVGRKWENPEKNHLTHPQAEQSGARTHTRHSGEMIEWLSVVMKYQCS